MYTLRPVLAKSGSAWQDGPKHQLCLKNSHNDATYIFGILGICRQTYNQRILKTKVTIVRYGPAKLVRRHMSHGSDRAPHTGQVTDLATSYIRLRTFVLKHLWLYVCLRDLSFLDMQVASQLNCLAQSNFMAHLVLIPPWSVIHLALPMPAKWRTLQGHISRS